MKELFIQSYVDKITKEDIITFSKNNHIDLTDDETDILFKTLKKNWKDFVYGNPTPILQTLKTKLSSNTYEKGILLYYAMKEKYQSLL